LSATSPNIGADVTESLKTTTNKGMDDTCCGVVKCIRNSGQGQYFTISEVKSSLLDNLVVGRPNSTINDSCS